MGRLFDRRCVVVVSASDAPSSAVRIDGLRTVFKVVKDHKKEPNSLDLKIYNLSATTRGLIRQKYASVVLSAGYTDNAAVVFSGDARTVDHVREGPDWVTHIQCGDGERAYRFSRFNASFGAGASVRDVILAAGAALGINVGNLASAQFERSIDTFAHGYAANGRAAVELDKLLRTVGLEWSIQDGAITVLPKDTALPGAVELLSPDTGLVGSPDHGTPDHKGRPSVVKATALLRPQLRVGSAVEIQAEGVHGQFRIQKVEHEGDTHGGNWYTSIEALPVGV